MSPQIIKLEDIFTVNKIPTYSYVERDNSNELALETCILSNSIAFVHGPTKSGKSALVRKVADKSNLGFMIVNAKNVTNAMGFWRSVAEQLDLPEEVRKSIKQGVSKSLKASITAKIIEFIGFEVGSQSDISRTEEIESIVKTPKENILGRKGKILIIDNFHYVTKRQVQSDVLRDLRLLAEKIPVILIAVTDKPDYLTIRYDELHTRTTTITIPDWQDRELMQIADQGYKKINILLSTESRQKLSQECLGAPAIMQLLCLNLGVSLGYKSFVATPLPVQHDTIIKVFKSVCIVTTKSFPMHNLYNRIIEYSNRDNVERAIMLRGRVEKINRTTVDKALEQEVNLHLPEAILHIVSMERRRELSLEDLRSVFNRYVYGRSNYTPNLEGALLNLHAAAFRVWQEEVEQRRAIGTISDIDVAVFSYNSETEIMRINDPYFSFFVRWSGHFVGLKVK